MDKTQLVDTDMQAGRQIIERLERLGISIDVALWLQDDETLNWQLVVSSPSVPKTGARPVYEALQRIVREVHHPQIQLDDVAVASPNENRIKDLKRRVGTNDGLHDIRLDGLNLGWTHFRSARIYRVAGGRIELNAHVRVKANGQLGFVRGMLRTSDGPRYLVLHPFNPDSVKFGEELPPVRGGQYAAEDLDFLYVVRTGGWPDKIPDWLMAATSPNGSNGMDLSLESTGRSSRR